MPLRLQKLMSIRHVLYKNTSSSYIYKCMPLHCRVGLAERRWRHRSTESDSSTGSSDASVWTTGVQAAKPPRAGNHLKSSGADAGWPGGRRFTRVKTLEEGAAVFSAVPAALFQRPSNNSESSDTATDNTTTTTTTTTASTTLVSARPFVSFIASAALLCFFLVLW